MPTTNKAETKKTITKAHTIADKTAKNKVHSDTGYQQQNALCVNVSLADIVRRQFVPTNCSCSPCQTIGEIRP